MDTEKTLDLNKPLFSYSRYERNEYGYGDDFIHRDVNAARNILAEGKRILSNTEGTAGHAGTGADITA